MNFVDVTDNNNNNNELGTMEKGTLADPFTQFYGQLIHQGNMLQDYIRTGTYYKAFMENSINFTDKIVLDVGTGTGILAMFAVLAGAKKVYAVEASDSYKVIILLLFLLHILVY